jgi:CTP:molybdopterin cytidylyltransferase MocA
MGAAKQLLDVGGRTMLEATLAPLDAAAVHGVMLVTHAAIAEQADTSAFGSVFLAINDDPNSEMIDSVRIGLDAWEQRATIAADDGFLVCPADQPGLATADFDACISTFRQSSGRVVIAAHQGKRGHPIIFPAALAVFVRSTACDVGLNALPRAHADLIVQVECASPAVTRNVNTPDEYDELR